MGSGYPTPPRDRYILLPSPPCPFPQTWEVDTLPPLWTWGTRRETWVPTAHPMVLIYSGLVAATETRAVGKQVACILLEYCLVRLIFGEV